MTAVPRVLSIAGTDPTGGAGVQADLKAIAAHDGYGMAVVTALVAQNTHGVRSVHVPDVAFLREQLDAVSDDVRVDAVKTGMLGTADVVRAVTAWLTRHRPPVVVVDPVMVATSGDRLLAADASDALAGLFAVADLLTPNRSELRVLADLAGGATGDPVRDALLVAGTWDVLVLAKGGHDDGPTSDDVLVAPDRRCRTFSAPRVATTNTHGTGCSLSSAIATLVARHGDWEVAVGAAKRWLTVALEHADALDVGSGTGPVDHGAVVRAALPPVSYTEAWWVDAADVLQETIDCSFLTRLADGTLDPDVFAGYLAQDVHYLRAYQRHLGTLAARTEGAESAFWAAAAQGCADEARDLHHRRLAGTHADDPVHPVCAGYLAHLQAASDTGSAAVLAAAVLPCFRVYAWVGTQLRPVSAGGGSGVAAAAGALPSVAGVAAAAVDGPGVAAADGGPGVAEHPYADWVAAYGDPVFAASSAEATRWVEEAARTATPAERGRMARASRVSTEWELAFFRMPLTLAAAGAGADADAGAGAGGGDFTR